MGSQVDKIAFYAVRRDGVRFDHHPISMCLGVDGSTNKEALLENED
jgi:hypothetical protein